MMKTKAKQVFKVLGKILGITLLLILLLLVVLRIPKVQTAITHQVVKSLEKKLNTEIRIDNVAANFVDRFCAEGIFIASQDNDTLLYAKELHVNIGFFKLFKNTIQIDDISINNVVSQIKQSQDSTYNFQFIVEAFAQNDSISKPESETSYVINLNTINLTDFDLQANLLIGDAAFSFDETFVNFRKFDLETFSMEFENITLDGLQGSFIQSPTEPLVDEISTDEAYMEFPLTNVPVSLALDELNINNASILYKERDFQPVDSFDVRYINAENIHSTLKNLELTNKAVIADLKELTFRINKKLELVKTETTLDWNTERLSLKNTKVETPESKLSLAVDIGYNEFNDLLELNNSMDYDLKLNEFLLDANELIYFVPMLTRQQGMSSLLENKLRMTGELQGNPKNTKVKNLQVKLAKSYARASGRLENILDTENIAVNELVFELDALYEDYKVFITDEAFAQKLSKLGDIKVDTKFTGNMEEMSIDKLAVRSQSLLSMDIAGKVRELLDTEKLAYDLSINQIVTGQQDVAIFIDTLPDIVSKFDTVYYSGELKGTKYKYDLNGAFVTSLGDIDLNADVSFNETYDQAIYQGKIEFDEFDLRELLDNDSLNTISMIAEIDGSGMNAESIQADIYAVIDQVGFNSYTYNNIDVEGSLDGRMFNGLAKVDDENIKLNFEGVVDMNDSIPIMNFDLAMDTLNLKALNFYEDELLVEFRVESRLIGDDFDEIEGDMIVRDLVLTNETLAYFTDSITFQSKVGPDQRGIYIVSPFLLASIEGKYELAKLPKVIINFMDQYFPAKQFLGESPEDDQILSNREVVEVQDDYINANIYIQDVQEIVNFFDIPITRLDSSRILFELDGPNNLTDFEFYVPTLIYNDIYIDSIYAYANNQSLEEIVGEFRIDSIALSETMYLAEVGSKFALRDQKAKFSFLVKSDVDHNSLGLHAVVGSNTKNEYLIDINEPFYLNDKEWNVTQDSSMIVTMEGYSIGKLILSNSDQSLGLAGETGALDFTFENFELQNFTEIIGMDSLSIKGLMNGDLRVGLRDQIPLQGDMIINNVLFNDMEIGDFDLNAKKNGDEVVVKLDVMGEMVNSIAIFDFNLVNQEVNGSAILRKLDLSMVNPFVTEYARNVEGVLSGKFDVTGSIAKPDIFGKIDFKSVEAFILPLETQYNIKDGTLDLYDDIIGVDVVMQDDQERLSTLKGKIQHTYFTDMNFDLKFNAEQFTFLDSQKTKRALFYGKFVAKVDAAITGNLELPVINADIVALGETDMTIQVQSGATSVSQENYIIFFDGNKVDSEEAIDSIAELKYDLGQQIELSLNISTEEDAQFHVVVDPVTGDKLDVQGTSYLVVNMTETGNIEISGDYEVTKGNYRLSYENTIKRNFALDPGSKIQFEGDPLLARLDMRALYTTKTSTTPLLENSSSSFDESTGSRTEVNVVLNVGGNISAPELSFDIVIPESSSSSSPIESGVTTALNNLKENEIELQTQVFSLILFNSFFVGGSSGGNLTSVGTSTAVSSIGNLVNQQLNKLSKRANGFEINFELDQYQDDTDDNTNVTEFGIGLKQKLFNNKVEIEVGGNANLETGTQAANNFSSFAGDFVIKYYLGKSGKYLVKVFQKSDYDALSNDSVWKTGVGISYKTVFGKEKSNRF